MNKKYKPKTYKVTVYSILTVCVGYLVLSSIATIYFGGDPRGIQQIIVQNLPKEKPISTVIYLLVAVSCLLTMPVLIAGVAEMLEKNCRCACEA